MSKHQLCKFIALLLLTLSSAVAQEKSNFSEENLPDKSVVQKVANTTPTVPDGSKSIIINQGKNDLANLLLGNKVSSLMFTDDENSNIERAIDSLKNNQIYSPEETEEEKAEAEADPNEKKEVPKVEEKKSDENEKSYIYLASIIYFTAQDWVVWVNEQKITPKTNDRTKELYLRSVQKDQVDIMWTISLSKWKILSGRKSETSAPKINANNQVEVGFKLKPNQTFILSTNSVVEGKAVIALLKKKEEEKKAKTSATSGTTVKTPSK